RRQRPDTQRAAPVGHRPSSTLFRGGAAAPPRPKLSRLGDLRRRLLLFSTTDWDDPRLLRLRHLTKKLDFQQSVLEMRAAHLNMVGELEAVLERAGRNAPMQVADPLLVRLIAPAANQERVLLLDQFNVGLGEARNRHHNAILVFAVLDDVVWGIALSRLGALKGGV